MPDLFDLETKQTLQTGAALLRGRALPVEKALITAIDRITAQAPFSDRIAIHPYRFRSDQTL